jgi:hypothetical protein
VSIYRWLRARGTGSGVRGRQEPAPTPLPSRAEAAPLPDSRPTTASLTQPEIEPVCPKCGGLMVEVSVGSGSDSGQKHLRCSNYPGCR